MLEASSSFAISEFQRDPFATSSGLKYGRANPQSSTYNFFFDSQQLFSSPAAARQDFTAKFQRKCFT
jgi:hypothetical protein